MLTLFKKKNIKEYCRYSHFPFSSDHIPVPPCMCVFLLQVPRSASPIEFMSCVWKWACVFRQSLSAYWYSISALCACVHTWALCLLLKISFSSNTRGQTSESQSSLAFSFCSVSQERPFWRLQHHVALETSAAFCQAFWSWIQQPWQLRHVEQIFTSESFSYPHTRSFSFSSDRRMCTAAEHQMRWWIVQWHQGETKLCAESEAHGISRLSAGDAECCKLQRWGVSARRV